MISYVKEFTKFILKLHSYIMMLSSSILYKLYIFKSMTDKKLFE